MFDKSFFTSSLMTFGLLDFWTVIYMVVLHFQIDRDALKILRIKYKIENTDSLQKIKTFTEVLRGISNNQSEQILIRSLEKHIGHVIE